MLVLENVEVLYKGFLTLLCSLIVLARELFALHWPGDVKKFASFFDVSQVNDTWFWLRPFNLGDLIILNYHLKTQKGNASIPLINVNQQTRFRCQNVTSFNMSVCIFSCRHSMQSVYMYACTLNTSHTLSRFQYLRGRQAMLGRISKSSLSALVN